MELRKLDINTIREIENKKIICCVKVKEYLHEIQEKFRLLERVSCIVDEHKRNWGVCECDGYKIPVLNEESLQEVDWNCSVLLITSQYYKEVYERISCRIDSVGRVVYYYADQETEFYEEYLEWYKDVPLEDIVVFRSGPRNNVCETGMDFNDNARAIFEYMLLNKYNQKYKLVWMVKDPSIYKEYENNNNVEFVSFDWSISKDKAKRDKYYRFVCTAKYFFFTDALDMARNKREGQIRVQLWHGEGFKSRAIFSKFEKRCEFTSVSSQIYQKIHMDIFGFRKDQVLIEGIAKQDWIFHRVSETIWKQLGIPDAEKYIFWLPTFRKAKRGLETLSEQSFLSSTGLPLLNDVKHLERVNLVLERLNIVMIIKLHPMQKKIQHNELSLSNIVFLENDLLVERNIHINQLLGYADALISDYSSVAVDFLLLNRPIAFVLDDIEEYKKSRGFVFDEVPKWLPGKEIYQVEEFIDYIVDISEGIDSCALKRRRIANKLLYFKDDNNCKRIIDAVGIKCM